VRVRLVLDEIRIVFFFEKEMMKGFFEFEIWDRKQAPTPLKMKKRFGGNHSLTTGQPPKRS